jgi:hypothetical protein
MLRDYARLIVFSIGLLTGIQFPGFVDQYAKRVSAHYIEAQQSFSGFQASAVRYFNGNVDALISHHLASGDPVFVDEAKTIQSLQHRLAALAAETRELQGSLLKRIFHVLFGADREIFRETLAEFSYTVPLAPAAIACGIALGLVIALFIEATLLGLMGLVSGGAGRKIAR